MSKRTGLTAFFLGAMAGVLSGCDVQVHDATPAQFPANHDVGMYPINATVEPGAMVPPNSVFVFGVSGQQRFALTANKAGTEWEGMFAVRCVPSFPLQILAVWKQSLGTEQKVVPQQPREVRLIEPAPTKEANIDTSGTKNAKTGWQGGVKYRFATEKNVQITAAHIEPISQDPADVASAKSISVTSPMPLDIPCGALTEVQLASSAQRAQGNLVIDSTHPSYSTWTTKVVFAPK